MYLTVSLQKHDKSQNRTQYPVIHGLFAFNTCELITLLWQDAGPACVVHAALVVYLAVKKRNTTSHLLIRAVFMLRESDAYWRLISHVAPYLSVSPCCIRKWYAATVSLPYISPIAHNALVHHTIRHLQIGPCTTFSQSFVQHPTYHLSPMAINTSADNLNVTSC